MEHGTADRHATGDGVTISSPPTGSTPTETSMPVRIVTFNVNGLKAVLQRLYGPSGTISKFLEDVGSKADIVCLQETKLRRSELTAAAHQLASADGWDSFFSCSSSSRGYSGTATFCRTNKTLPFAAELGFSGLLDKDDTFVKIGTAPRTDMNDIPSFPCTTTTSSFSSLSARKVHQELLRDFSIEELRNLDTEGRVIITDHSSFILFNIYAPAVTKEDPEQAKLRLAFKMRFYTALQRRWEALMAAGRAVIVVGDMNIAPAPLDFPDYDPEYYKSTRPDRIWLRDLLSLGGGGGGTVCTTTLDNTFSNTHKALPLSFVDCFRKFHPARKNAFTVWSTATGARSNNYGSRIDLTLSAGLYVGKEAPPLSHSIQAAAVLGASPPPPPPLQQGLPQQQQQQQQPQAKIVNNEVYISAADIEPTVQGSDHCPAWVEVKLTPNNFYRNDKIKEAGAAPAVFPCSRTVPPCAMRFCGKQTKLHSWLAMGKTTQRVGEVVGEEEASEDVGIATRPPPPPPPPQSTAPATKLLAGYQIAPGGGGSSRPKQMSLKSFVKVSSSSSTATAAASIAPAPQKPTEPTGTAALNTKPTTVSGQFSLKNSTFLQAELQAAAALEQKQLSSAKNAWQAIQEHMQTPMCLHGDPAALKKVNKSGPNQGRFFYMCARGKGQGPHAQCSFFKWVEKKPGDAPRTTIQDNRKNRDSGEAGPVKRFKK